MGPPDEGLQGDALAIAHPQVREVLQQETRIEDSDHQLLAESHGERGDAELNLRALIRRLDSSVLGLALLRDVEASHRLDPVDHGEMNGPRDRSDRVEHPVNSQANDGLLSLGLDVNIARPRGHRVAEQIVDRAHDVAVIGLQLIEALQSHELLKVAEIGLLVQIRFSALKRGTKAINFADLRAQIARGAVKSDPLYGDGRAGTRIARILASVPLAVEKRLDY